MSRGTAKGEPPRERIRQSRPNCLNAFSGSLPKFSERLNSNDRRLHGAVRSKAKECTKNEGTSPFTRTAGGRFTLAHRVGRLGDVPRRIGLLALPAVPGEIQFTSSDDRRKLTARTQHVPRCHLSSSPQEIADLRTRRMRLRSGDWRTRTPSPPRFERGAVSRHVQIVLPESAASPCGIEKDRYPYRPKPASLLIPNHAVDRATGIVRTSFRPFRTETARPFHRAARRRLVSR